MSIGELSHAIYNIKEMGTRECSCVVRGSINFDEYFHVPHIVRPGETISSFSHESRVGGKGANQAVAIVRAGGKATLCGTIGSDGLWLKDKLEEWCVDVDKILVSEKPTGRAIIQVDDEGENSIILFPGANHSKDEFNGEIIELYREASHLLLQNEIHLSSTYFALTSARNAIIFMNPSPLPSPCDIPETRNMYHALISDPLIRKPKLQPLIPTMSTRELVASLSSLPKFKKTNIICTLGSNGVLAFVPTFHRPKTENETPSFMYLPAAKVVGGVKDTTGAGDTFAGYVVQGIMEFGPGAKVGKEIGEKDVMKVLKVCIQAAGMSVERSGTIDSIPTKDEVEERLCLLTVR